MNLTADMLTGKSREHLVNLPTPHSPNHFLQAQAVKAFQGLQKSAVKNGFNLQPASSFRDFARQQQIWNGKFNGERKVHDDAGKALDLTRLDDWQKCQAILRWSALPGASRHHWGTEIDIFDPDLLPPGQALQLEPWEYEKGGYFFELSEFLAENLPHFDFVLPFMTMPKGKKIGREPWHISYVPLAEKAKQQFSAAVLLQAWENEEVAGSAALRQHLPQIFEQYFV
ncbi:M15 family metallopeptidase [Aggregatibacter actinomycetemcomitans]|uniref:M15 family metallopeptidase n=1 Tax=Aggregatibacter actinomycetemcomitans TaxID=714 RepID=UPI0011D92F74|nr:M15 family metallopeptidase [Aggregatibacter actinomycetemcomitans]TYB05474.1 M15 family metallopeptidase [Aggregatibacter actinomycetemcomitans]